MVLIKPLENKTKSETINKINEIINYLEKIENQVQDIKEEKEVRLK